MWATCYLKFLLIIKNYSQYVTPQNKKFFFCYSACNFLFITEIFLPLLVFNAFVLFLALLTHFWRLIGSVCVWGGAREHTCLCMCVCAYVSGSVKKTNFHVKELDKSAWSQDFSSPLDAEHLSWGEQFRHHYSVS